MRLDYGAKAAGDLAETQQDQAHFRLGETMPFEYTLPTTGAISFSAFVSTPPIRLNAPLAEAAAQRGRLRDILKRLKRADDKDILAVIKVESRVFCGGF